MEIYVSFIFTSISDTLLLHEHLWTEIIVMFMHI